MNNDVSECLHRWRETQWNDFAVIYGAAVLNPSILFVDRRSDRRIDISQTNHDVIQTIVSYNNSKIIVSILEA